MHIFNSIKDSILIVAPLPPASFAVSTQAAEIVTCLANAGLQVRTLSAVDPSYCTDILNFSTKKYYLQSLQTMLSRDDDLTILFPQALNLGNSQHKRWLDKRKEELRKLKFITRIAFAKRKVVMAYPGKLANPVVFACAAIVLATRICRPFSVRLARKRDRGVVLARKILGKPVLTPDAIAMEQAVFKVANQEKSMRMTPNWFRHAVENLSSDNPAKADLKQMLLVISKIANDQYRVFDQPTSVSTGNISDHIAQLDTDIPISAFMLHLRHQLKLEHELPIETATDQLTFINWYVKKAPDLAGHALPLLKPVFAAFKAECKKMAELQSVASLLQADSRDIILPTYLTALQRRYPEEYRRFNLSTKIGRIAFAYRAIVDHARFEIDADFLGASLNAYFSEPVSDQKDAPTRFALITAVLAQVQTQNRQCLTRPWDSGFLTAQVSGLANAGYPLMRSLCGNPSVPNRNGIVITGDSQSETGLGKNQLMSAKVLSGLQVSRPVFLHHNNADAIPSLICKNNRSGAFHIGFLLWEFEKLPEAHKYANRLLDEIWTPSTFVQSIYKSAFGRNVTMIGKGFDLPDIHPASLAEYGFEPGNFVFLCCFDMHSSVARKNPLAAVKAFRSAFPSNKNMRFILKTTPSSGNHWGDPDAQMAQIEKIASQDKRIVIDRRFLAFNDLLALIKGADCIVSSHRSEGFGYIPAYALKFAVPVIATDYSGTKDFCTNESAYPVAFNMRNVMSSESIFPVSGAQWAEVDPSKMAQAMRNVTDNVTEALRRAQVGQDHMNSFYSTSALALRYRTRLQELELLEDNLTFCSHNVPILHGERFAWPNDSPRRVPPIAEL